METEPLSSAHAAPHPLKMPHQHQYALLTPLSSNVLASTLMMLGAVRDSTAIATIRAFSRSERSTSPSIPSAAAATQTLSSSLANAASLSSNTVTPLFPSAILMQPPFPHV